MNGAGLVTGIASGICAIKATASDNASAFASTAVGVALLSANSLTIAYGNNATISMSGDSPAVNWCGGCPGPAEVVAGTLVNGFVVAEVAELARRLGIRDQLRQSSHLSIKGQGRQRRRMSPSS